MKEDFYISLLKYGRDKDLESIAYEEVYQLAVDEGFISSDERDAFLGQNQQLLQDPEVQKKKIILDRIFEDNFEHVGVGGNFVGRRLTSEGYFHLLEHEELKEARAESKKANKRAFVSTIFAAIALVVGIFSAGQQISSNELTQQSIGKADLGLQLAVEPQVQMYLEKVGEDEDFYVYNFGIENTGVVPINSMSGKYTAASIQNESGLLGVSFQGELFFEERKGNIFVAEVKSYKGGYVTGDPKIGALIFEIQYQRDIDKKVYRERVIYIVDDFKIYLPEQAKTIKKLKGTVERVNEYTAQISPDKVYWQEI